MSDSLILVVEDNVAINVAICDILELHGFRTLTARDGNEALEILADRRPDVIVCDIMMPGMDGYSLLRRTRQTAQLRTIPFIFLTARASEEDIRQAKRIGIEDYLIKPINPEDLILAVENALRRAENAKRETQRQMENLRNQIVGTLQHEFRTPLTFIMGYAEYLNELIGSDRELDALQTSVSAILEGGQRLQDLIEKFLLLADVQERYELPQPTARISLRGVILTAVRRYEEAAEKADLILQIEEEQSDVEIDCDPDYLNEALSRLLDNAIVYRRPDSRNVWISVLRDEGEQMAGICVRDEGRGIPTDQLDDLRSPFEQVERANRNQPGAGLSLALVHHIARLHGGRLEIESQEESHSTFVLWLPI